VLTIRNEQEIYGDEEEPPLKKLKTEKLVNKIDTKPLSSILPAPKNSSNKTSGHIIKPSTSSSLQATKTTSTTKSKPVAVIQKPVPAK